MKKLVLFLLICFVSPLFGQTNKMKNKLLTAELSIEEQRSDSLYEIHYQLMNETSDIRSNMVNRTIVQLEKMEKEIETKKKKVSESIDKLQLLGYNPDSILTKDQLSHLPLRSFQEAKEYYMPYELEEYLYVDVSDRPMDIGRNIKEENEIMKEKIAAYRAEYPLNVQRKKNLEDYLAKLKQYETQLDTIMVSYEKMNHIVSYFEGKMRSKLDMLKEEYRRSGPNGFPEVYAKAFPDAFEERENVITQSGDALFAEEPDIIESNVPEKEPPVYLIVEQQAEFIGGMRAFKEYLAGSMRLPEIAKELEISGKVYVKFVVTSTGEISKVQLVKGIEDCRECDDEAIRLVKAMPRWKPAMNDGKTVDSWFTLPISFVVR